MLWEEGLTVPQSLGQTMWLMLSTAVPGPGGWVCEAGEPMGPAAANTLALGL